MRIEQNDAFAQPALHASLSRASLPPSEAAAATDLVFGVLRWRNATDWWIAQHSHRALERMDASTRCLLRMAAYERLRLEPTPAHVVGHEYAGLARAVAHDGVARYVNAICRRLTAASPEFPRFDLNPLDHLEFAQSHPRWICERWVRRFGSEATLRLCSANNSPPPQTFRVNTLKATCEQVEAEAERHGLVLRRGLWSRWAYHVSGVATARSPLVTEGRVVVQGEGSMLIGEALGAQPGETIVDACAAPGGKTSHLAALMENRGSLHAVDLHPSRVRTAQELCARAGVTCASFHARDLRDFATEFGCRADRVLLDAPCSGTGTLRRNPDLRWRLTPERVAGLAKTQRELLAAAAALVRPGGWLLYSTCSLEAEENEEIVSWFLSEYPGYRIDSSVPLAVPADDDGFIRLWPTRHDTDGMFLARLQLSNS